MTAAKATEIESSKRYKELAFQLKDSANIREKQLKDAENQLKLAQKKSENSRREWKKREEEAETLNLEISEMRKAIEAGKAQLLKAEEKLAELQNKSETLKNDLKEAKNKSNEVQKAVKVLKDMIHQQNKEIQKHNSRKEDILKQKIESELAIQKLNHEINSIKNEAKECRHRLADLIKKYEWIEQDKAYFGKSGTK